MSLLPVTLPEVGRPVKAIIKHFNNWNTQIVSLVAVDEDDCNWRFVEDDAELDYSWNVVYWEYDS